MYRRSVRVRLSDILLLLSLLFLLACNPASPRPKGYFRIDLPEKEYRIDSSLTFASFAVPQYASLQAYSGSLTADTAWWQDMVMPRFNARIHLTYKPVNDNLATLIDDAHEYVGKHTSRADAILQTRYEDFDSRVFGVLFDIRGNAASTVQFFVTDSLHHFVRGALYFNAEPNKDSLSPVINFIREDILYFIETMEWK